MNSGALLLITGASRGIGAATALLAARQGYRVVVNYHRNEAQALRVVETIHHEGGEAWAIGADISQEAEVAKLFAQVDKLGELQGLVNNAGVLQQQCRLEDISLERWQRIFAVNTTGTFLCCREAIKRMATGYGGQGGAIVNVSSGAAKTGSPFEYVDYAAAKGAVDSLTIGLGKEVAAQGIRVNGVRPGLIYTDIHADGGEPGRVDRLASSMPLGRGGEPEEVAQAILWLLSPHASFTTGSFIDVLGGR